MRLRRHRSRKAGPRGTWLAFLAVAMQVLVPFFLMVDIARAERPDGAAVICSALGHSTDRSGNASDHGFTQHCPICTALAAAQAVAPPAAPPLPLPGSVGHSDLIVADVERAALLVTAPYQSRGPPSIA